MYRNRLTVFEWKDWYNNQLLTYKRKQREKLAGKPKQALTWFCKLCMKPIAVNLDMSLAEQMDLHDHIIHKDYISIY